MTPRQKQALEFIRAEVGRTGGVAPSHQEIAAHLGLKSKSGAHRLIDGLIERGHLRQLPGRARSIVLIDADLAAATDTALLAEAARRGLLTTEARHAA